MKSEGGKDISISPGQHAASVHGSLGCRDCHTGIKEFPHPARARKVECAACHEGESRAVPHSAHSALGAEACQSCHGPAHYVTPSAGSATRICAQCHEQEVKELSSSVHGAAAKSGDPQSPSCQSCHGPVHRILPVDDPQSSVAKKNLPDTCGACHSNSEFQARHQIPYSHPVEAYRLSIHGRAVAAGNSAAAGCSDCHGSHGILPGRDPRAKINHWNVVSTCGTCHSEIRKIYEESVHGQAVAGGSRDSPVCTDCHGEHTILAPQEARSSVNPGRVSTVTCGRCHSDERLASRYSLVADRVPTFADSYHGLESRAGGQTVANCASCHGVHDIFPSSDPRSTVNPANLARTCGKCHRGAGTYFAIGAVHVAPRTASEPVAVRWIREIYWVIIPFTLGFMLFHHLVDFIRKARRSAARGNSGETLPRMNLHFRMAHWMVVASFPVLVITGFALKFPDAWWAKPLLLWESRFAFRGLVHRAAGVLLVGAVLYHAVHLILVRRDRGMLREMLPAVRDARELVQMVGFNLGLAPAPPSFGKFNYVEKMEYLAFLWGTVLMAVTGFTLWFNNLALRFFPKWFSDAATALHYYEAILATFSILIWHMYTVVFDPDVYPMDRAWLTGMASADHLRHTRPEYYDRLRQEQERKERKLPAPAAGGEKSEKGSSSGTPSEGKEK
jgi:cytochrome b subunit of formate dehydrogenase/5-methylcytosine-specific restriction endonuclease McrA